MMPNSHNVVYDSQNWQAQIHLLFTCRQHKTLMKKCHHLGPLRVQRPFYPETHEQSLDNAPHQPAHIYLLHPPGGVVGGDQLTIDLHLEENAQVLFTTPGSGKFYLSPEKQALLQQDIHLGANASLEWLPQENILFRGARLQARSRFHLDKSASLIAWDITCLGRPTNQERFDDGELNGQVEIFIDQQLMLVENSHVFQAENLSFSAGLRDKAIQASLFVYPSNEQQLSAVRELLQSFDSPLIGASLLDDLLVVRALHDNSEQLKNQLISIWKKLRPLLLNRTAHAPRIWST